MEYIYTSEILDDAGLFGAYNEKYDGYTGYFGHNSGVQLVRQNILKNITLLPRAVGKTSTYEFYSKDRNNPLGLLVTKIGEFYSSNDNRMMYIYNIYNRNNGETLVRYADLDIQNVINGVDIFHTNRDLPELFNYKTIYNGKKHNTSYLGSVVNEIYLFSSNRDSYKYHFYSKIIENGNDRFLVVYAGNEMINGIVLNRYIVHDINSNECNTFYSESNLLSFDKDISSSFFNSYNLKVRGEYYGGYLGFISDKGNFTRNRDIEEYIQIHNLDFERALYDQNLINAYWIKYNELGEHIKIKGEINESLLDDIRNKAKESTDRCLVFEISNLNNAEMLDSLRDVKNVVFRYSSEITSNYFFKDVKINNFYMDTMLGEYYSPYDFVRNLDGFRRIESQKELLSNFIHRFRIDSRNDIDAVNTLFVGFYRQIFNGNMDAARILNNLVNISKLNIKYSDRYVSYWSPKEDTLFFTKSKIDYIDYSTFFHEVGHALYTVIGKVKLPNNFDDMLNKARVNLTKQNESGKLFFEIQKLFEKRENEAQLIKNQMIKDELAQQGFYSKSEYIEYMINKLKTDFYEFNEVKKYLLSLNLNEQNKRYIKENNIEVMVELLYDDKVSKYRDYIHRTKNDGLSSVSDIYSAIFKGKLKDLKNRDFYVLYSHGQKYYKNIRISKVLIYHELIANFTDLKLNRFDKEIELLKYTIGEDLFNELDRMYNSFIEKSSEKKLFENFTSLFDKNKIMKRIKYGDEIVNKVR